jgi:hypothetical protein
MSYENRHTGEIRIDPPLSWAEIKDSPFHPDRDEGDVKFQLVVDDETGAQCAVALVSTMDSFSGYYVKDGIKQVLETYGTEATFTGFIEVQYEAGSGSGDDDEAPMSRYYVLDNKVFVVEPKLSWPTDDEIRAQYIAEPSHG